MAVPYRFLNKKVPITEYHIDANKINNNFDSITETGEAFEHNKVIGEYNLKDTAINALVFGVKDVYDTIDDFPTTNIYNNTIMIAKQTTQSGEAGWYKYNNGSWDFILDLVPLHKEKHESGGVDELDLSNLKGSIIYVDNINEQNTDNGVHIEGILHKNGRVYVPTPVDDDEPTPKKYMEEYVQQYVQGLDYQNSVLDKDLTTPPTNPSNGDRYLLYNDPDTGTDWEGHKNDIAEWDNETLQWIFITPNKGFTVPVEDEDVTYTFNGIEWIALASTVRHNITTGIQGGAQDDYYHFTGAEHDNILSHVADTTIHYQKSDIKHSDIQDDEPEKHRLIDDNNISNTSLYSSQKIEDRLATKADNKDYPLKWQIVDFIQDGSVIDSNPSANGYNTAGEIYAISDSGNIYNGNVYRVSDSDTWELLETRSKGLGVLKSSDLKEYYYSSDDGNGQWNNYFNNYESHMGKTFFDNLLKNGEMEFWIDANTPKNWKVVTDGTSGSHSIIQESSEVRYGLYSLKLEVTQAYTDWGLKIQQAEDDNVTYYSIKTHGVETQWRFKVKLKSSVVNAVKLSADVKINGTWNTNYISGVLNSKTNEWEDLSLIFTSQSDWEEFRLKIKIAKNITGTFYIDTAFAYNGFVDIGYMGKSSEGGSNKNSVLKWMISGFITDDSHLSQSPSSNGYTLGEIYAVSQSGSSENGNVYKATNNDTWQLLDQRFKGLGVLLLSNLTTYFYSSNDNNGWWNDNLVLKQDKPSSATAGNVAIFDNNKNTIDSNKKIETTINDTDSEIPTSKAVKTYVDNNSGATKQDKILNVENYVQLFDDTGNAKASDYQVINHNIKNTYFNTKILESEYYANNWNELKSIVDFLNSQAYVRNKTIFLNGTIYFNDDLKLGDGNSVWGNIRFKGLGNAVLVPKLDTNNAMFQLSTGGNWHNDLIIFDDITFSGITGTSTYINETTAKLKITDRTFNGGALIGKKIVFSNVPSIGWAGGRGYGTIIASEASDENGEVTIAINSNTDHKNIESNANYFMIYNEKPYMKSMGQFAALFIFNCHFSFNSQPVVHAYQNIIHDSRNPSFIFRNNTFYEIRNYAFYGNFNEYGGIIEGNNWYTDDYSLNNTFTNDVGFLYTTSYYSNDITIRYNKIFMNNQHIIYPIRWSDDDRRHSMRIYGNYFQAWDSLKNITYAIYFEHYGSVYGYDISNNYYNDKFNSSTFTNATHDPSNHKYVENNKCISYT